MIWSAQLLWLSHSSIPQTALIYYYRLRVYLFSLLLTFFSLAFYSCKAIPNYFCCFWQILFISCYCYLILVFSCWFSLNLSYSYWVSCSIRLSSTSSCFGTLSCCICVFNKLSISTTCKASLFFYSFSAIS